VVRRYTLISHTAIYYDVLKHTATASLRVAPCDAA